MNSYFKVKASWMKACGYQAIPTIFKVNNIEDFSLVTRNSFFAQMVHVTIANGSKWIVALGRGEFISCAKYDHSFDQHIYDYQYTTSQEEYFDAHVGDWQEYYGALDRMMNGEASFYDFGEPIDNYNLWDLI